MSEKIYDKFFRKNFELNKSELNAHGYATNKPLNVIGEFQTFLQSRHRKIQAKIYVIENAKHCLLSCDSSINLNLVKLNLSESIDQIDSEESISIILENFQHVFEGIGKYSKEKVKLHIKKEVKAVAQPHRRQPLHTRELVEEELNSLLEQPAEGATPWISPIVVVPKKENKIRLCVDMRVANTAIERERFPVPTTQEIKHKLNGSKYFSKLDMNKGYHQLELDEESRKITVFMTHKGLFRYKRLFFGINTAAEIFQKTVQSVICDVPGALNYSDDIIVFGKTVEEHNEALKSVLKRFEENNLTLNKEKCDFLKESLKFFGCIVSKDGMRPDPEKITAIKSAMEPKSVKEVRSFLGLVNYCSSFINDLSTICKPLRDLTKQGAQFIWTSNCRESFEKIKSSLTNNAINAHFDPKLKSELTVDASPVGLAAVLCQYKESQAEEKKIIAFASRSLSDVEQRYSQTEKEGLALVWGCEHFHIYLYGSTFTSVITDHKPLELIFNNPKSKPPARIERWLLRLQDYNFSVKYKP